MEEGWLLKIRFRQSGGFAGLRRRCDLDAHTLVAAEQHELERLVQRALTAQPRASSPPPSTSTRDSTTYEIEIDTAAGTTRLALDDESVSEEVEGLVAFLQRHARSL